jgi:hypothetical protein
LQDTTNAMTTTHEDDHDEGGEYSTCSHSANRRCMVGLNHLEYFVICSRYYLYDLEEVVKNETQNHQFNIFSI